MKPRLWLPLLALAALSGARPAAAQQVDITFTPGVSRSVSASLLGGATFYNFGAVQVASAAVGILPVVITNDGNVASTLALEVSPQATDLGTYPGGAPMNQHWAISNSTATGVDTFALFAVFQSSAPTQAQYGDLDHVVRQNGSTAPDICASATRFAGGQTGLRVPAAAGADTRNLWLILRTPTRSSNLKQKNFRVSVTTGACD